MLKLFAHTFTKYFLPDALTKSMLRFIGFFDNKTSLKLLSEIYIFNNTTEILAK